MRNLITHIVIMAFSIQSWAGMTVPPTSAEKQFLSFSNALSNPGLENGITGWSAVTTAPVITTTSGEYVEGSRGLKWNPVGADILSSPSWVVKTNGDGNAVAFVKAKTADADYDLEVYDGTNIVATVDIPTSTSFTVVAINFIASSATTYKIRVNAPGDEGDIFLDNTGIGYAEGYNLNGVSQASFVGKASVAGTALCSWGPITNSAFTSFTADSDCPVPTVTGQAVAPATKIPAIKFNSMKAGTYYFVAHGGFTIGGNNQSVKGWRFNDGTTGFGAGYGGNSSGVPTLTGTVTYSTAKGATTIEVQGQANSSDSVSIATTSSIYPFDIEVYYFPNTTDTALDLSTIANSWSGYHDNTCSLARTNTAYGDPTADASCALVERTNQNFGTVSASGSVLPAITFTPKRAGKYQVCAYPKITGGTLAAIYDVRLTDGSTVIVEAEHTVGVVSEITVLPLCGLYTAANTSAVTLSLQTRATSGSVTIAANSTNTSAIEWSIFQIDQSFPAPVILNSVFNSSPGTTRIEVAKLNCDAASTITSQHGSWISSIGNIASGACAITLSAVFSATPYCTATPALAGGITTGQELNVDATSSTAVSVDCEDDASTACTVADFILTCMGAK